MPNESGIQKMDFIGIRAITNSFYTDHMTASDNVSMENNNLTPATSIIWENYSKKTTPVVLVEAEKTAVIMSHHEYENIWLATGGCKGLSKSKARVLKGRKVFILFDNDEAGKAGSRSTEENLNRVHAKPIVINMDFIFKGIPSGYDIADCIFDEFSRKAAII